MSGVIAFGNANMVGKSIGKEHLSMLQDIMQAHPTLVSVCVTTVLRVCFMHAGENLNVGRVSLWRSGTMRITHLDFVVP